MTAMWSPGRTSVHDSHGPTACRARMCASLRRLVLFFDNLVVVIGILKECRRGAVSSGSLEAFSQGSRVLSCGLSAGQGS